MSLAEVSLGSLFLLLNKLRTIGAIAQMSLTVRHIHELLEPGAQALDIELVAVELSGSDSQILRIYIDRENGVDVEDCATASRQFSAILDVEDPIANRYTLEVSSPGLDRPLAKPEHFKAQVGEKVKIRMATLVNGRRRFTGTLVEVLDNGITVDVDGEQTDLDYVDMDRARLVPTYDF